MCPNRAALGDAPLQELDPFRPRFFVPAGEGTAAERGDRSPGDDAVPFHQVIEHRGVLLAKLVEPGPDVHQANEREANAQTKARGGSSSPYSTTVAAVRSAAPGDPVSHCTCDNTIQDADAVVVKEAQ